MLAKLKPHLMPPLTAEQRFVPLPPLTEKVSKAISNRALPALVGALKGARNLGVPTDYLVQAAGHRVAAGAAVRWPCSAWPGTQIRRHAPWRHCRPRWAAGLSEPAGALGEPATAGGLQEPPGAAGGLATPPGSSDGLKEPPGSGGLAEPPGAGGGLQEPPAHRRRQGTCRKRRPRGTTGIRRRREGARVAASAARTGRRRRVGRDAGVRRAPAGESRLLDRYGRRRCWPWSRSTRS